MAHEHPEAVTSEQSPDRFDTHREIRVVRSEREWQLEQALEDYRARLRELARDRDAQRAAAAEARRERDVAQRELADLRHVLDLRTERAA